MVPVNIIVWWLVLMIPAWILAAYILWGTNIVVSQGDEDEEVQSDERGGE